MQQLSGSDNLFLLQEKDNNYIHVSMLFVYDVATAPGGKVRFKDILKHFEERVAVQSLFRRRLAPAPMGIDRPYWIEEPSVDLEFHVRHIALPHPGDWRQFMIQVARLHSRPLDRSHPLWEAYIIEGLDGLPKATPGAFAMMLKLHHALVDGMATMHLVDRLHSASPAPESSAQPKLIYADRELSTLEFFASATTHAIKRAVNAGRLIQNTVSKVVPHVPEWFNALRHGQLPSLPKVEKTRFGGKVSPHRVVGGFGIPLSRIKQVRTKIPEATVNDIFLAVCGGGVRAYLDSKHELPTRAMNTLMPVALRSDGSAGGNAVGGAFAKVHSEIADPIERLQASKRSAQAGKAQAEQLGLDLFGRLSDVMPGSVLDFISGNILMPALDMAVSNVRGPASPMYLAGAKAMCFYPVSIPLDGVGLNVTGVSYNGVLWITATSCRQMMPDPNFFIECMQQAWNELMMAANALPDPVMKEVEKVRRRKTAKAAASPAP